MPVVTEYYEVYYPGSQHTEDKKFDSLSKAVACAIRKAEKAYIYECQVDATGYSHYRYFVREVDEYYSSGQALELGTTKQTSL